MKTPLPEQPELTESDRLNYNYLWSFCCEIHDYLAELTEVVEGKEEMLQLSGVPDSVRGVMPTPTLKERLLGEIRRNKWAHLVQDEEVISLKEVEAIINRLIP